MFHLKYSHFVLNIAQVDGQEEEEKMTKSGRKERVRKEKSRKDRETDKYKGYEILLTGDDDPGYKPPKGRSIEIGSKTIIKAHVIKHNYSGPLSETAMPFVL